FVAMARSLHAHARDRLHFRQPWLLAVPLLCASAGFWYRATNAVASTAAVSNEASADIAINVRAALVYLIVALSIHATLVSLVVGRLLADLRHKARHDVLTGLLNRRAAEDAIEAEMQRMRRSGGTLSLLMLDIDHFKGINDRFGHPAGDQALRHVADILQANVRAVDHLARIGGEEFLVLMPEASLDDAAPAAERLRAALAAHPLLWQSAPVALSVSVGVAESAGPDEEASRLMVRVDAALYRAKAAGRNRVIAAEPAGGAQAGQA
ncbi:MAG TPA: GGDEF domain-containing protein, partial [Burkholderiaceae bacterium]|nr:GGDEF domain-containing protein [Burkholderiaceae bacterium]